MVLVTGATGLIGAHIIAALLKQQKKVRALYRSEERRSDFPRFFGTLFQDGLGLEQIEWVIGDVMHVETLEDAMSGCDEVYHCAALVSFHPKDHWAMMELNVLGTANVVNVALDLGVSRFCHISSTAAIGRPAPNIEVSESAEWKASPLNTVYATSKYLSELEVWRGIEEGLSAVILNPAVVIGVGDFTRGSTALFTQIDKGMPMFPGGSNGFVSAKDVAAVGLYLMEQEQFGERYIVCAENLAYQQLISLVSESIHKPFPKGIASPMALRWLARFEALKERITGRRAFATKESVRNASNNVLYKNDKLKGVYPFPFQGIQSVINEVGDVFINSKASGI